jgi:hypothetical protein
MAMDNNNPNSLNNLTELAAKYKTNLSPLITSPSTPGYEIADISKEELDNISTFISNAVIKDSTALDSQENAKSLEFAKYLKKYFESNLSTSDIIDLKVKVDNHNQYVSDYIYSNLFTYVYELDSDNINSLFNRTVNYVKTSIETFIQAFVNKNTSNKSIKKTPAQWYGKLTDDDLQIDWFKDDDTQTDEDENIEGSEFRSERLITVEEFYNSYFLKGKIIETLVLLHIISYGNSKYSGLNSFSLEYVNNEISLKDRDVEPFNVLENENFFINFKQPTTGNSPLFKFGETLELVVAPGDESTLVVDSVKSVKKQVFSLKLENIDSTFSFYIPVYSSERTILNSVSGPELIVDLFNIISNSSIENGTSVTVSFDNLFKDFYANLYGFLNNINYINNDNSISYNRLVAFFYRQDNTTSIAFSDNLLGLIKDAANLFYYKDMIYETILVSPEQTLKNAADTSEYTATQNGEQLTFITTSGILFTDAEELASAQNLFNNTIGLEEPERGIPNLLSYNILYKEFNPLYREVMLIDAQEFTFARMIQQSEQALREDVNIAYGLYKTYLEEFDSVFLVSSSFTNYKYFYGNVYNARISSESDIIGYYIGDNTEASAFTLNYGSTETDLFEIESFLDIYKTSRDYYYKVLLNKSFIQDSEYKLYEKLFIAFLSIERFLTSKIDNVHDLDFYNARDIYNFLESYGLGILNRFDFFLGIKDYKLNIIRNYNELIKKKGSKDVIDVLLKIFDLGNVKIEIKKFILLEQTRQNSIEDNITISIVDDTLLVKDSSNITIYSETTNNILSQSERVKTFGSLSEEIDNSNASFFLGDVFIDAREYIASYFIKDYIFIANYTNASISIYSEIENKFIGSLQPELKFGEAFSNFEILPFEFNIYRYVYVSGIINNTPTKITELSTFLNTEIVGVLLDNSSKETTQFTIQNIDDVIKVIRIVNSLPVSSTNLYKNNISKSFYEVLKDLGVTTLPTDNFSVNLGGLIDVSASELVANYVSEPGQSGFIDIRKVKLSVLELDNVENNSKTLNLRMVEASEITGDNLVFVEVPYLSENGTREIQTSLGGSTPYSEFVKLDPYWNEEDVPESTLLDIGIDAIETKYLSLKLNENVYKKHALVRYFSSAIDYLEEKFIIPQYGSYQNMLNNISIDTGEESFGVIRITDFFNVAKILFKVLIALYEQKIGIVNIIPTSLPENAPLGFIWFDKDTPGNGAGTLYVTVTAAGPINDRDTLIPNPVLGNTYFATNESKLYTYTDNNWDGGVTVTAAGPRNDRDILIQNPVLGNTYFANDELRLYTYTETNWVSGIVFPLSSTGLPVGAAWFNVEESKIMYVRKYYGINTNPTAFDRTLAKLNDLLSDTISEDERKKFFETERRLVSPSNTEQINNFTIKTFYPYERVTDTTVPSNWFNFTESAGNRDSNLNSFCLKNKLDENKNLILNKVANNIKNSLFSNIKTQYGRDLFKKYRSSGDYMLETLYGLNYIHLGNQSEILNKAMGDEMWLCFLSSYFTPDYRITNPNLFFQQLSSKVIDRNEGYERIIDKMIKFPMDNFDGLLHPLFRPDLTLNKEFVELSNIMFEDIFTTTENTLSISAADIAPYLEFLPISDIGTYLDGTNINEKIAEISQALITGLDSLQTLFISRDFENFSFSFEENETQSLRFVKTAVELFLSYTTTLYRTEYQRVYNTPSESVPIAEDIKHILKSSKTDNVFYDEKLIIIKEED